jgi:predicted small lipoprotein YifL
MTRTVSIDVAALIIGVACGGCGQKGPLYLRDSPPPGVKPPKAKPYEPVPYPKDGTQDGEQRENR